MDGLILIRIILGILIGFFIPGYFVVGVLFPKKELTFIERFVFSFAISAGILDAIMIFLAVLEYQITFVSVMSIELFVLLCAFIAWLINNKNEGLPTFLGFKRIIKRTFRSRVKTDLLSFNLFLVILIVVIEFFIFYNALIIPIFYAWDTLSLYAPYSEVIFLEKTVHWNEWIMNGLLHNVELYGELRNAIMFGVWGYICNGSIEENFAKIISPVFSVMISILMVQFSEKIFKNRFAALCSVVILLYFCPMFAERSQCFHVDIPLTFFWFCATYATYLFMVNKKRKYAILLGLMTGFTLLAKKVGFLFIPFLFALFFVEILRDYYKRSHCKFIKNIRLFIIVFLISTLIAGILYIKLWIVYGNPIYPYMRSLLGGRYFDPQMKEMEDQIIRNYLSPFSIEWLLFSIDRIILESGLILFILYVTGIVLSLKHHERPDVRLFLTQIVIFVVPWYFSGFRPRQLLPIFPLLAIYAGSIFASPIKTRSTIQEFLNVRLNVLIKRFALVFLIIVCILFALIHDGVILQSIRPSSVLSVRVLRSSGLYKAIGGRMTFIYTLEHFVTPMGRQEWVIEYTNLREGMYEVCKYVNSKTPPDSTILSMDDRLIYFLDRRLIDHSDYRVSGIYQVEDLPAALEILRSLNIGYLVTARWMRLPPYDRVWGTVLWSSLDESIIFEEIFTEGDYFVYKIHYENLQFQ